MDLSVFSVVLFHKTLEKSLEYLSAQGVHCIELPTGGNPGKTHVDPKDYLGDPEKIKELLKLFDKYNTRVCAVSTHDNGIHPNKELAQKATDDFRNSVLLAEQLGVETVITFSGCAGDCEDSKYPNWVTCSWPTDYLEILKWQWEEKLIPYWKEQAEFAKAHGIKKIAFELHPGFMVYNPESLIRIREAVGDIIGANLDPSHLFWQGIDPIRAVRELKDAIFHVHAKDTKIDDYNCAINGVLDTKGYEDFTKRSWIFRTVGYGHGYSWWNDFISELKRTGYDGAISIEHEDALMSPEEGLEKAIKFLQNVIIFEKPAQMWWV